MEVWCSMEHLVLDGKVGKSLSLVLMPTLEKMGWGEDGLLQGLLPSFSSSSKSSPSRVEKTVYFGQNKTASPKPSSLRESVFS